jgi:hypothetical protein
MRVKFVPFLISLSLLVGLLVLVPLLLSPDLALRSNSAWLGVLPGFGLGLILATCSSEEQAGTRGLLFIPLSAMLGMTMAIICWVLSSFVGDSPMLLTLIYGLVNLLGGYAMFALIRRIYDTNLDFNHVIPVVVWTMFPSILLLLFSLTPFIHGLISAGWVAAFGVGVVRLSSMRKRTRLKRG